MIAGAAFCIGAVVILICAIFGIGETTTEEEIHVD